METGCLEGIGPKPVLGDIASLDPEGCPDGMACLDMESMVALSRWIGETLRWMEQAELACYDGARK